MTSSGLTAHDAPNVVRLKAVNYELLSKNHCRNTVKMKNGEPVVYSGAINILEMMFGRNISNRGQ